MAGPSGLTPNLALPYPLPGDTVDVPRDIQALATKLDPWQLYLTSGPYSARPAVGSVPESARYYAQDVGITFQKISGSWIIIHAEPIDSQTIPATPIDGMRWRYKATLTSDPSSAYWVFRYSAGKWLVEGAAAPMWSANAGQISLVATTNWQLTAATPSITLPFIGFWRIKTGATIYVPGGQGFSLNLGFGSPTAVSVQTIVCNAFQPSGDGFPGMGEGVWNFTAVTDVRIWAAQGYPGNGAIGQRMLSAEPIMIG